MGEVPKGISQWSRRPCKGFVPRGPWHIPPAECWCWTTTLIWYLLWLSDRAEFPELWMMVALPSLSLDMSPLRHSEYFHGWRHHQVSLPRNPKCWGCWLSLYLTFCSIETMSCRKFSACLVPGRLGWDVSGYKNWIILLFAWWFYFSVTLGINLYLSYGILLVRTSVPYIWLWFSGVGDSEASFSCHHFRTGSLYFILYIDIW